MAEQRIYHWRHGWIPLDHYAAVEAANGRDTQKLVPTQAPKATAVSAVLRRAGFRPVAPSDHNREGLKVKQSGRRVRVVADLDSDRAAQRMAEDAAAALTAQGHTVSAVESGGFYVGGA